MARKSWGSTRILTSGRVQARYTGPDGEKYKAPETFPDELEALAWFASVRRKIDLGVWESPNTPPAPSVPTVGQMVQHWLDQCRVSADAGDMRVTSLVTYTGIAKSRILKL